jgi:hypothetical protein
MIQIDGRIYFLVKVFLHSLPLRIVSFLLGSQSNDIARWSRSVEILTAVTLKNGIS